MLYFYTDVVGISPLLAGWIYALGIGWDAITDPYMGYIAERTRTKMGSYRPYILFGSIPLAFSFNAMTSPTLIILEGMLHLLPLTIT